MEPTWTYDSLTTLTGGHTPPQLGQRGRWNGVRHGHRGIITHHKWPQVFRVTAVLDKSETLLKTPARHPAMRRREYPPGRGRRLHGRHETNSRGRLTVSADGRPGESRSFYKCCSASLSVPKQPPDRFNKHGLPQVVVGCAICVVYKRPPNNQLQRSHRLRYNHTRRG